MRLPRHFSGYYYSSLGLMNVLVDEPDYQKLLAFSLIYRLLYRKFTEFTEPL
ncbi:MULTISPECIES: hypothetical protein [Cyanophyceae]|uniref:hypothetical protein n=1 Tax=Cyanophyceae TaxID=3028117 RepID=UPI00168B82CC